MKMRIPYSAGFCKKYAVRNGRAVYTPFMQISLPPTQQEHTSYSTPKDFFLHLLAIVTLYVSVVSFMSLLFQYINIQFPDALNFYYTSALDSIRWSTASLIVMYPVYIFTSWLINRDIAAQPEKANLRIRKWLIYLTLFIAALTIIIDLIILINYFLSGEITVRFVLKILVVLITAGIVFGYYIWDLRRDVAQASGTMKLFVWIVSALALVSIVAGFFLIGSPFYQRKVRFDDRRVSDLQTIQYQIINYWQQKNKLPEKLQDLNSTTTGFTAPLDPETGNEYEYKTNSDLSFDLCTTFGTPTPKALRGDEQSIPLPVGYDDSPRNWMHDSGHVCFTRTIDPDMYKPQVPPPVK